MYQIGSLVEMKNHMLVPSKQQEKKLMNGK